MPIIVTESGKELNVSNDQIAQAIQSGQWWDLGESAYMKTKDKEGNVFALDFTPQSIMQMQQQGYAPFTFEDEKEEYYKQEHGSITGMSRTAAISALDGATFGLASPALMKAGLIDYETVQRDRQVNPGVDALSNITGAIAPILLTGGVGGASSVAKLAPTAQVAKTATAIEKSIAASMQAAGYGKGITALTKAVPYAVEGSLYGLGQEISHMIQHDKPLAAEHLMTNMGLGAALGYTSILGMDVLGKLAKKGKDFITKSAKNEPVPTDIADAIYKQHILQEGKFPTTSEPGIVQRGLSILADVEPGQVTTVTKAPIAKEMRQYIGKEADEFGKISKSYSVESDALSKVEDEILDKWGAHKFENIESRINQSINSMNAMQDDVLGALQELDALSKTKEFGPGVRKATNDAIRQINHRFKWYKSANMDDILNNIKTNADVFHFSDEIKKAVGKANAKIARRAGPDELAAMDRLQPVYGKLKDKLEDRNLWGTAATDQRIINKPMSDYLSSSRASIKTKVGNKNFIDVYETDPGKVNRIISKIGDPESLVQMRLINRGNERFLDMVKAFNERIGLTPGTLKKVEQNIQSRRDLLTKASKVREANRVYTAMQKGKILDVSLPIYPLLFGGALAGWLGGWEAMGIGMGASMLMNPASYVRFLKIIDRFRVFGKNIQNTKQTIGKSAKNYVNTTQQGKWLPPALTKAGLNIKDYYDKTTDSLLALQDSQTLYDTITEATPGIQEDDPEMALHLFMQAMDQVSFLNEVMPKELTYDLVKLARGEKPEISEKRMRDYLGIVAVCDNPMLALKNIDKLSEGQIEALKRCAPNIYEALKAKVLEELSRSKGVSYEKKVQLSRLLGVPTDSTLEPQFIKSMQFRQEAYRQQENREGQKIAQARQRMFSNNMISSVQSESSRLANKV